MPGPNRKNQSIETRLSEAGGLVEEARRKMQEATEDLRMAKEILEEELRKVTEELSQMEK